MISPAAPEKTGCGLPEVVYILPRCPGAGTLFPKPQPRKESTIDMKKLIPVLVSIAIAFAVAGCCSSKAPCGKCPCPEIAKCDKACSPCTCKAPCDKAAKCDKACDKKPCDKAAKCDKPCAKKSCDKAVKDEAKKAEKAAKKEAGKAAKKAAKAPVAK